MKLNILQLNRRWIIPLLFIFHEKQLILELEGEKEVLCQLQSENYTYLLPIKIHSPCLRTYVLLNITLFSHFLRDDMLNKYAFPGGDLFWLKGSVTSWALN